MLLKRVVAGAAIAVVAFAAGIAVAGQPKMEAALHALEHARGDLERAEHDKGGHRVEALKLIDRAIDEVREGIRAGA
jgi:hypothetical protein